MAVTTSGPEGFLNLTNLPVLLDGQFTVASYFYHIVDYEFKNKNWKRIFDCSVESIEGVMSNDLVRIDRARRVVMQNGYDELEKMFIDAGYSVTYFNQSDFDKL